MKLTHSQVWDWTLLDVSIVRFQNVNWVCCCNSHATWFLMVSTFIIQQWWNLERKCENWHLPRYLIFHHTKPGKRNDKPTLDAVLFKISFVTVIVFIQWDNGNTLVCIELFLRQGYRYCNEFSTTSTFTVTHCLALNSIEM